MEAFSDFHSRPEEEQSSAQGGNLRVLQELREDMEAEREAVGNESRQGKEIIQKLAILKQIEQEILGGKYMENMSGIALEALRMPRGRDAERRKMLRALAHAFKNRGLKQYEGVVYRWVLGEEGRRLPGISELHMSLDYYGQGSRLWQIWEILGFHREVEETRSDTKGKLLLWFKQLKEREESGHSSPTTILP